MGRSNTSYDDKMLINAVSMEDRLTQQLKTLSILIKAPFPCFLSASPFLFIKRQKGITYKQSVRKKLPLVHCKGLA